MAIETLRKPPPPQKRRAPTSDMRLALTYVSPALLGVFFLSLGPIFYTIYISLTNRNGPMRMRNYQIIGLDNYERLLGKISGDFYIVVGRTLVYTAACVVLFFIVGLFLALIVNNPKIKARNIWRVLLIVPWTVPSLVTALIWKFFFNEQFGPINNTLKILQLPHDISWLGDPSLAFLTVIVVNLWLSYPFFMVIILGALQSIPDELYEAARIDGASRWEQLFRITLPLLRPAVVPAVILSAITTFQMFNTVWLITEGGPTTRVGKPGATEFVMIYVYKEAFRQNFYALASAFGVLIFVFLFVLILINNRLTRATRSAYE